MSFKYMRFCKPQEDEILRFLYAWICEKKNLKRYSQNDYTIKEECDITLSSDKGGHIR